MKLLHCLVLSTVFSLENAESSKTASFVSFLINEFSGRQPESVVLLLRLEAGNDIDFFNELSSKVLEGNPSNPVVIANCKSQLKPKVAGSVYFIIVTKDSFDLVCVGRRTFELFYQCSF